MLIGELSKRTGVSTKTIRFYEEIEVLPEPERELNGYRTYDQASVDRLRFVRDAQSTGLTLDEIAVILELRGKGEGSCEHVVALLERHLESLEDHIERLVRTRDQLASITGRAKGMDPADCTDPNRCQTIDVPADLNAGDLIRPRLHRSIP